MSELQSKEGFCSKEENELYAIHFYEKVMQLTCFISYLNQQWLLWDETISKLTIDNDHDKTKC